MISLDIKTWLAEKAYIAWYRSEVNQISSESFQKNYFPSYSDLSNTWNQWLLYLQSDWSIKKVFEIACLYLQYVLLSSRFVHTAAVNFKFMISQSKKGYIFFWKDLEDIQFTSDLYHRAVSTFSYYQ